MTADLSGLCLIAGRLEKGQPRDVINPATGKPFGTFHAADAEMLDTAVEAARTTALGWRMSPMSTRRQLLYGLADVIKDQRHSLARLLTLEQGKPLVEALAEIQAAEAIYRHYSCVHSDHPESLFAEHDALHRRTYAPLGVVAGIIPWNFPFSIAAMKAAPAVLAGNAIILKPAPTTPITALEFGRLCADLVPPGLIQILGDDGTIGPLMTGHPGIRKISFTGSTLTGRKVVHSAADTLKRVTLELGGNDPAIVLPEAIPVVAAKRIFQAAFTNAGQICGAVKRVYVHSSLYERFVAELTKHVEQIVVGDGLDPNVTLGPVQNKAHFRKVTALLADAKENGRVLCEVSVPQDQGFFVPPTLVEGLDENHPLVCEEQFGPVLPLQRFEHEDEVIAYANGTPYGLTASVWSENVAAAEAVAVRLDASLICINKHNECPLDQGIGFAKLSGAGWLLGDEGIKEYLQSHLIIR